MTGTRTDHNQKYLVIRLLSEMTDFAMAVSISSTSSCRGKSLSKKKKISSCYNSCFLILDDVINMVGNN